MAKRYAESIPYLEPAAQTNSDPRLHVIIRKVLDEARQHVK